MKRLIFSILFLLLCGDSVKATTYHVATDGSGDFTTISQVNSYIFENGDSILFKRGDVFNTLYDNYFIINYNIFEEKSQDL